MDGLSPAHMFFQCGFNNPKDLPVPFLMNESPMVSQMGSLGRNLGDHPFRRNPVIHKISYWDPRVVW